MNKIIKKIGALSLGILLAGSTIAAGLAKTFAEFPGFLGKPGTEFWVVVGQDAAPSDVVGAVDLAARLAELSTVEKEVPTTTVTTIEGKDMELKFGDAFPRTEFKQTQVPFLWDGKIEYNGEEYRTYEKIIVDGILGNDPSKFNGTTYVELQGEQPIKYVYVFADKISEQPTIEKPLVISLLGKEYQITKFTNSSITLLSGVVGIAKADYPIEYAGYKFYAVDAPSTGDWVEIQIKDADGNIVDDLIINKGEKETVTLGGKEIEIKVLQVWASDISQKISAKLAVGEEVEKEITEGTGEDNVFPEDNWYLVDVGVSGADLHSITIAWIPEEDEDKLIKEGEKVVAPNNYFEVGYSGLSVKNYATLTVEPVKGVTIYDTDGNKVGDSFFGLKITASEKVLGTAQDYDKAYVLLNATHYALAYEEDGKAVVYTGPSGIDNVIVSVPGVYDETSFTVKVQLNNSASVVGINGTVIDVSGDVIELAYHNKSDEVYLGPNSGDADANDVSYKEDITKDEYKYVVTDWGAVIEDPYGNAEKDKVVIKIPSERQKGVVYVGRLGETVTEGGTYKEYVPITVAVAKLDTEVPTDSTLDHNLVVVGGPAINRVAAALLGVPYPTYGATLKEQGILDENQALVKIYEDAFGSGKIAVLVAGWSAENTRVACSILQQYDTKLTEEAKAASEFKVIGATVEAATIQVTE